MPEVENITPFDLADAYGTAEILVMWTKLDGDAYNRYELYADGTLLTGDGTAAPTTFVGGGATLAADITDFTDAVQAIVGLLDVGSGLTLTYDSGTNTTLIELDGGGGGGTAATTTFDDTAVDYVATEVQTALELEQDARAQVAADLVTEAAARALISTNLTENVQDIVGAMVLPTSGIVNFAYSDGGNTLTVAIDTTILDERIRDVVGTAVQSGTYVTVTVNDGADTITFELNLTAADGRYQLADADLAAIALLSTTSFGRSVLTMADATALRALAGAVIGTNVQAYSALLATIAAQTPTNNLVLKGNGTAFVAGAAPTSPIAKILARKFLR